MNRDAEQVRTLQLGDDVNTDDIIPAARCTTNSDEHLGTYALEHILGPNRLRTEFDVIDAGANFGCGSSREHAPRALKAAGIRKVRAGSFAEIFFRNSVNIGLPLELTDGAACDPITDAITESGGLFAFNRERLAGRWIAPAGSTGPRPMTMAEKMLARASGNRHVRPGQTVFARVDLAMSHDAVTAPMAALFRAEFGEDARVNDPRRVVFVADHFIQVDRIRPDAGPARLLREMRAFAREQGCRIFDTAAPGDAAGICHVLLPEEGLVRPGMVIVGTDSHTCTYGAFGCLGVGIGTTDFANLMATGDVWLRVPASIRVEIDGTLPHGVCAKDLMLALLGRIGCSGATGRVLEFAGSTIATLSVDERMTLANMAIECGAMCGLLAADETTCRYVAARTSEPFDVVCSDEAAEFEDVVRIDANQLVPLVARPPRPDNVIPASELADVRIHHAYVGSCTGGKLDDLREAAAALDGRSVHPGVRMFIVPASQRIRRDAERLGYLGIFERAGATVLATACGACINAGPGVVGHDEVGIFATNRNFTGRSGHPSARNYLASPRVVALSAVAGRICADESFIPA